jgi:hypothetical protein
MLAELGCEDVDLLANPVPGFQLLGHIVYFERLHVFASAVHRGDQLEQMSLHVLANPGSSTFGMCESDDVVPHQHHEQPLDIFQGGCSET